MTILQNAAFQGTEHNDVRPGATVKRAVVENWLKDQAAVYEGITGAAVPNAGAIAATPHVHDGTNGALIRLPLAHSALPALLYARDAILVSGGTNYEDYYPWEWRPFFAPAGVTRVAVLVLMRNLETFDSLRCTMQSAVLADIDQQTRQDGFTSAGKPWLAPGGGLHVGGWLMDVTAGAVNVVKLEAWDGYYVPGTVVSGSVIGERLPLLRSVQGFAVVPIEREPVSVAPAMSPVVTDNVRVKVPSSFTSFDDHLVQPNRALPSYVLVSALKNDALLREVLTGRPAANRSVATFDGHSHKNDAATSLDDSGADIDHALGSWGYGTVRPPVEQTGLTEWAYADVPAGDGTFENAWDAAIAPQPNISSSAPATDYTLFYHRVRIPAAIAANLAAGTGKLKLAALVYDLGVTITVQAALGNAAATSFDTVASGSSGGAGREVITISGLECTRPEEVNTLRIQIRYATEKAQSLAIYGVCLYYEA